MRRNDRHRKLSYDPIITVIIITGKNYPSILNLVGKV